MICTVIKMTTRRYLIRFSYLGTQYRGSQKHAGSTVLDVDSIQGALESSLSRLNHKNVPNIVMAGRTDAGVHALNMTAHIDIQHNYTSEKYPDYNKKLVQLMNRYLINTGHEIRVFTCYEVNPKFHARFSAKTRTYLYRFCMPKDVTDQRLPISEHNRSLFFHPYPHNFDMQRFKNGLELFKGTKDFMTFSARSVKKELYWEKEEFKRRYVKTLDLRIEEATPLMPMDPLSQNFSYWHLTFQSKSFLYNQIRRIVGTLFALGLNRISEEDIITMLQVPSHHQFINKIQPAKPHGLYLLNVDYDEEDIKPYDSEKMKSA
ncbi:tRNA pseudouridine synthase-like 1 [Trichogramma pretiosum]|uniref:tRNA pseudouridine synthase-like 1 n=1 Tax=Trichogramma pretiosum TaxID=7493 RepID=UPI000C718A32|nr:tRNA pseudouridine synthase-like 1 [Trichogramma pretiosum]